MRTYDIDALACSCGGRLTFIATILEPTVARSILKILLAMTALGAIDTWQGSECRLATRALGCETLRVARSPQAEEMRERAARYARSLLEHIRDPSFRRSFMERKVAQAVLNKSDSRPDVTRGVDNPRTPTH